MYRAMRVNEPWRLLNINIISERALKEYIVNIKLTNWPIVIHDNGKYDVYSDRLDNRTERVMKVNVGSLMKAFSHKAGFITGDNAIEVLLHFVNPLTTNNVL